MVAVTFSIPSNILLPSPLKAFIYEHSRQKVAAVAAVFKNSFVELSCKYSL